MESSQVSPAHTEAEREARRRAELRGSPFLVYRDDKGAQRIVELNETRRALTIGRRFEADISLPWDREVSRLHAQIEFRAGEWTVDDDGWSQNGTFVNEIRLDGQRRLQDGDLVRCGQTAIEYCHVRNVSVEMTLVPGELSATPAFSQQQQQILRELCRPLMGDGEGLTPSADDEIAERLGVTQRTVTTELEHLARSFGLQDMPFSERRAEIAMLALRSGLVKADD
jgi:pSer/pThr/pTyr-binding forkhead associated (FHA) protein